MKKIILSMLLAVAFSVVAEKNVFDQQKVLPGPFPGHFKVSRSDDPREYMKKSECLTYEDGIMHVDIPKRQDYEGIEYRYLGFGPFPVKECTNYTFSFRNNKIRSISAMYNVSFLKNNKVISHHYLHSQGHIDCPTWLRVQKDVISPKGADAVIVWFGVSKLDRKNKLARFKAERIMSFGELALYEGKRLTRNPKVTYNKNLLPVSDFEDLPLGSLDTKKIPLMLGKGPKAEIVKNENQALRLTKNKGDNRFIRFEVPLCPYGQILRFQFRAKGQGTITPGIWFWRGKYGWVYHHTRRWQLTDQWQDVYFEIGCPYPFTDKIACSFSCVGDDVTAEIDDVSCFFVDPARAN